MAPFFSVIVPIYKVEPYLCQCVDSILAQTFTDFELFLVDDGSPDNCGAICDEYAAQDSRITVIHQPNGGVVSAWKAGILAAVTDYVGFVDSDDWIDDNYFEELYSAAVRTGADVVEGQFVWLAANGEIRQGNLHPCQTELSGTEAVAALLSSQVMQTGPTVANNRWTKFYRRSLLLDNMGLFDERIKNGDDVVMNTAVLADARQVVLLPSRAKYHYRITVGSLYQTYWAEPSSEDQLRNTQYYYQALLRIAQEKSTIRHIVELHLGAHTYRHIYGDCTRAGESLRTRTALIRRRMSIIPPEVLDVYADDRGGMFIHIFCRMLQMGLTVPCAWTIQLHHMLQGSARQPSHGEQDAQPQTAGDAACAVTPVETQPDRCGTSPLFSVIVPIYKVEPYLRQCVDSILAQTFTDFELFLVDDGSPDNCGAICDEYAAQDSRITVIHQQNAGLTRARKSGLLRAVGEYVCFVDSDDWVEPGWLETLRQLAVANERPDIILFEHRPDVGEMSDPIRAQPGYYDRSRLEAEIYPYMLCDLRRRPFGSQLIPAFVVERACRRQLLLDHYIPDDVPITLYEDTAMSYECMYYARSMVITTEPLYIYRRREGSILSSVRPQYYAEIKVCFDYLRARLGGKEAALDRQINAQYIFKVIGGLVRELEPSKSALQLARSTRSKLGSAQILPSITFKGLPADIQLFLLLLKCRLYLPAVWLVKLRM